MSKKCSEWNKNCTREQKVCKSTKNVLGNNKCDFVVHYGIGLSHLTCMVLYGLVCSLVWPYVASYVFDVFFFGHDYYYLWPH